ncbi:AraC family transcriptional regulator [Pseudomonas sp. GOM6]|uniref:AraC family transcriptional regulator n=1 Tax=Pseudomonas sp. GOM6 TaxID=3036944 RepID=UPI002409D1AA|nr:AraC family transcriptional regulator [Pseudomonas sp. GOM6]MDG1579793.1 AraC family transcriptional regulator ligand-binding domain-containing protein [Pseudomonas sp. GOM6]
MTLKNAWYENDSRFIPGHWQPAVLVDLALSRGIDSHRLLRGTGLFHEDLQTGHARLSPQQFLQLIDNGERLLAADDTRFLFGQRLLPGHYGAASHALQHATNLGQALDILCRQRALLSPLLSPRLLLDEHHVHLYWLDSCGAGNQQRFLVESAMTALLAMSRWLAGAPLPWQVSIAQARPRQVEQYWVHLGEEVRFDAPLDLLSLPREYLHQPWPGAAQTAGSAAQQQSEQLLEQLGFHSSLLDHLYRHLLANLRRPPQLDSVALALGMSPSTLKRKLHKHGTHFQEQLDLARKHMALYLYQIKGQSNDEVAAYLQFHDATNFRRSFKRWTGLAPSALRQRWQAG